MQLRDIPNCSMAMFGDGITHFWTGSLLGLAARFPVLETLHRQDFYMLLLNGQPGGEIVLDHQIIRLDGAKAVILTPGCMNRFQLHPQAAGRVICFTDSFFSLRYNSNILSRFSFLQRRADPSISIPSGYNQRCQLLARLLQEEAEAFTREESVLRSYLNIMLFELDRLYCPSSSARPGNLRQQKIAQFEMLINSHFASMKLPSAYAGLLYVSTNYLNKLCKEETGQTAGELIRHRIAIEAQRLLHHTHCTVSEIAIQLGFVNIAYFATFFRKQTGMTPEQFRKTQQ